jgi:phosphatidylglycerophosphatase A
MRFVARLIATGLFTGYTPFFPGTIGSLLGLVLYWAIPNSESAFFVFFVVLLFLVGVWAAGQVESHTQIKDNQTIVVDEVVGMFSTVLFFEKEIIWLAIGLVLFRLFDIIKVYPARQVEKLPHGWGVMMDDVIAGIYGAAALRMLYWMAGKV